MLYTIPDSALDGGGFLVETRAWAIANAINALTNVIQTGGYSTRGDGGGALYKRVAADPGFPGAFQSADGAWWQIYSSPICPEMFGAIGDGVTDDTQALNDMKNSVAHIEGRVAFLNAKIYVVDGDNPFTWDIDNSSIIGCGKNISVIQHANNNDVAHNSPALIIGNVTNLILKDFCLKGADCYGAIFVDSGTVVSGLYMERIKATTFLQHLDTTDILESNGMRVLADTGSFTNFTSIDCDFIDCARMGIELWQGNTPTTVNISQFKIVRPRFINIGPNQVAAASNLGYGISVAGFVSDGLIDSPYFASVANLCIEQASGVSQVTIKDVKLDSATFSTTECVVFSASDNSGGHIRPMYGNIIDGIRWVAGDTGDAPVTNPPTLNTSVSNAPFSADNWHNGVVMNVELVCGDNNRCMLFGNNVACNGNLITNNLLTVGNYPYGTLAINLGSNNNIKSNQLNSGLTGGGACMGIYGVGSLGNNIEGNVFNITGGSNTWVPVDTDGSATFSFTIDNVLSGRKLYASGTAVILNGTNSITVNHGMGVTPNEWGAMGETNPGGYGPFGGADATTFTITFSAAMGADYNVHWWCHKNNYGNL